MGKSVFPSDRRMMADGREVSLDSSSIAVAIWIAVPMSVSPLTWEFLRVWESCSFICFPLMA